MKLRHAAGLLAEMFISGKELFFMAKFITDLAIKVRAFFSDLIIRAKIRKSAFSAKHPLSLKIEEIIKGKLGRLIGLSLLVLTVVCGFSACGGGGMELMENGTAVADGGSSAAESSDNASASTEPSSSASSADISPSAESASPATICVYVCGAVETPGVYELPEGARVYEAIEKAGGFTPDAEESYINQALVLHDADEIRVPSAADLGLETEGNAENAINDGANKTPEGHSDNIHAAAGSEGKTSAAGGSVTPDFSSFGVTPADTGSGSGQAGAADANADGNSARKTLVNLNTADAAELMTIPGIGESKAAAILAYREEHGSFQSIEEIMQISGIKEKMFEKIKNYITV